MEQLAGIEGIKEIRGKGLMVGIELQFAAAPVRTALLKEHNMFTGSASNKNTLRILPPLTINKEEIDLFISAFKTALQKHMATNEAVHIGA
jgi:acetylornithine aminotransferase